MNKRSLIGTTFAGGALLFAIDQSREGVPYEPGTLMAEAAEERRGELPYEPGTLMAEAAEERRSKFAACLPVICSVQNSSIPFQLLAGSYAALTEGNVSCEGEVVGQLARDASYMTNLESGEPTSIQQLGTDAEISKACKDIQALIESWKSDQ